MNTSCYTSTTLENFASAFAQFHRFAAPLLCVFGLCSNLMAIVVLCQPSMRNPTNALLTSLSLSDSLMSAVYLPFSLILQTRINLLCPEPWLRQMFLWVQLCASIFAHAYSLWITVTLGVFRLVYIKLPVRSKQLCTMRASCSAICITFAASLLMVLPNVLGHRIVEVEQQLVNEKVNDCQLEVNRTYYKFFIHENSSLNTINFWVMGVCIKCLPVLLLTGLSFSLIRSLRQTARRRRTLKASSSRIRPRDLQENEFNRTTKLLSAIVVLSVASILPQGVIFGFMGSQLTQQDKVCFTRKFYDPLGDLFDFMTLCNHCVNFVFYYSMSKQFRCIFLSLVGCPSTTAVDNGSQCLETIGMQRRQQQLQRVQDLEAEQPLVATDV